MKNDRFCETCSYSVLLYSNRFKRLALLIFFVNLSETVTRFNCISFFSDERRNISSVTSLFQLILLVVARWMRTSVKARTLACFPFHLRLTSAAADMALFLLINSFLCPPPSLHLDSLCCKFVIVVCQIQFAELMIYFEKQLNVTWEERVGCLCNQKEIRHQLLTLAGCRVPSRCCLSLLVQGV